MSLDFERSSVAKLPEFIELLEEAGAWLWQRGIRQWEPGSNRAQHSLLSQYLQDGVLLLAREPGRDLDGLAGGCIVGPIPTPEWRARPGQAAYLHKLVVARHAAGRGLGARLVEQALDWTASASLRHLRLDCWDGNDVLRRYYREHGFRELEAVVSMGFQVRLFEADTPA